MSVQHKAALLSDIRSGPILKGLLPGGRQG
ncbi:hypothetical protein Deipe_4116 (plasmid) [Deinococcus peraridilitoris DSM 19664]|uniref:Uncharacterized protein n=1 Tax=Deinococcus peraridilitoris (strain DSM 19664 / LMG 22246 / CIP 109416 / KR-200) TaxID=937777 RepID=L0A6L4_DEIPD|nr:hypothetical protein Deipe_4116 [Deinococcus peraridilitoris DSM 19664]